MALRLFVEVNGWSWRPMPNIDDAEQAVFSIAAGTWDEEITATWLRRHLTSANDD